MIIKSASVTTVAEDRLFERSARLQRENFSKTDLDEARKLQLVEPKSSPQENAPDDFTKLFIEYKDRPWFARVYGTTDPFFKTLVTYRKWYSSIAYFNPIPLLEKLDVPIFWIFGDAALDHLGPVEKSITNLEALKRRGKRYHIAQYEGEGHNVNEKKYRTHLHNWLKNINGREWEKLL